MTLLEDIGNLEKRVSELEKRRELPSVFWLGLFGFLGSVVTTLGQIFK